MSQFRKTWTRIGSGAVAVAAATALIAPGIAAADDNDSGSSGSGSLERVTDFLPDDVRTVFTMIRNGDLDVEEIGDCVRVWFAEEELTQNPFQIVIHCVLGNSPDDLITVAENNGVDVDQNLLNQVAGDKTPGDDETPGVDQNPDDDE